MPEKEFGHFRFNRKRMSNEDLPLHGSLEEHVMGLRHKNYDEIEQKLCELEIKIAEYEIQQFTAFKKNIGALERRVKT